MSDIVVSIHNADIFQGDNLVLQNVNFNITRGEFVYLVGKTGTGKSSLLKTLYGELTLTKGEASVVGFDLRTMDWKKVPFVIAGKNPSEKLVELAHAQNHTCLVANPSEKEMQDMIAKAHINVIPSFTTTGMKTKLVNALFHGRHCVVNDATIAGSGLEAACHIGTNANAFCDIIAQLYHQPFTPDEIELRKHLLTPMFNNEANAKKQVGWIWG